MELKEFIPEVISNIVIGVKTAISQQNKGISSFEQKSNDHRPHIIKSIELDVSYQLEQNNEKNAGVKLTVFNVLSAGGGATNYCKNTDLQHLHIAIPIDMPVIKFSLDLEDPDDKTK